MDNLPEVLTRITSRLDALESRVSLLEHPSDAPAALPAPASLELPLTPAIASSSLTQSGATFAVVGKAMIGMAGAYLLRAVAESGSFPKLAVVALAIAYACTWLIWAARVPIGHWFAATTYGGTSALIFAPMLWELTLRFKALSPSVSAALLAGFIVTAYALAWRHTLTSIVWVASLATAVAATALLVGTHDMEPFLAVLLLMALLSESAACRDRWLSVRIIVALAADLATWTLLYIYASPDRNLADYADLTPRALLVPPSSSSSSTAPASPCEPSFSVAPSLSSKPFRPSLHSSSPPMPYSTSHPLPVRRASEPYASRSPSRSTQPCLSST